MSAMVKLISQGRKRGLQLFAGTSLLMVLIREFAGTCFRGPGGRMWLEVAVLVASYDQNPYSAFKSTENITSQVISISFVIVSNATQIPLNKDTEPISLTFSLNNSKFLEYVGYVRNDSTRFPSQNLTSILGSVLKCRYWDTIRNKWSSEGVTLLSITANAVSCGAYHTTDFAVEFFDVGLSRGHFPMARCIVGYDWSRAFLRSALVVAGGSFGYGKLEKAEAVASLLDRGRSKAP